MFVGHIGAGAGNFVTANASGNSLRFRAENLAYLKKINSTLPTSTSNKIRLYFISLKRTEFLNGGTLYKCNSFISTNVQDFKIWFSATTGTLVTTYGTKGVYSRGEVYTVEKFKDTSGWVNITIAIDTTQTTDINRVFIYVDDIKLNTVGTVDLNYSFADLGYTTNGSESYIGTDVDEAYLDCYLSKFIAIDGYPTGVNSTNWSTFDFSSLFINLNTDTGKFIPKEYNTYFGATGFKLEFKDGSSLSSLGKDSSRNAKHWEVYNFSIAEGWENDWLFDNPTTNYALLNVYKVRALYSSLNKACTEFVTSYIRGTVFSTLPTKNDKPYYFEVEVCSSDGTDISVPMLIGLSEDSDYNTTNNIFQSTQFRSICYQSDGKVYNTASLVSTVDTYNRNFTIGVYRFGNYIKFYTINPSNVITVVYSTNTFSVDELFPVIGVGEGGTFSNKHFLRINFGQRVFKNIAIYEQHVGGVYEGNLPLPSITNPKNHFDIVLRNGTGAAATVSSLAFSPGLIWTKNRTSAKNNSLTDKVRGTSSQLATNSTAIQTTLSTAITAINSNGYSLGTDTVVNLTSTTLVDWVFAAGSGTPVTNNDGTKTSTVSANPAAGFSIVKYVGQTSGTFTVGHGLGSVPDLVIGKRIDGGTGNWVAYFRKNNLAAMMYLNTTAGIVTALNTIGMSGDTAVSINTTVLNGTTSNYLLYCFKEIPGYSKIGKYLGNGSMSYVYCGFRPRFILIKSTGVGDWCIYDTSRSTTTTPLDSTLYANLTSIETVVSGIDILSHGFTVISTDADLNTSDVLYYFMAIA